METELSGIQAPTNVEKDSRLANGHAQANLFVARRLLFDIYKSLAPFACHATDDGRNMPPVLTVGIRRH